jgi:hypothetical protein
MARVRGTSLVLANGKKICYFLIQCSGNKWEIRATYILVVLLQRENERE